MRGFVLMLMLALVVAACDPGVEAPVPDTPPATAPGEVGPDVDVVTIESRLVGLSLVDAEAQAEMWGLPLRVARIDDETFAVTDDLVVGRITVEVDTIDGVETVTDLRVETDPDGSARVGQ